MKMVVLQKLAEEHNGQGSPFLLGLGRHSKEAGDEGDLPGDVSLIQPLHLSLPDHVHDLVPLERPPCRFQGKEAHPRLDQPFDKTMVLLDEVVEVFDLPQFDPLGKESRGFELGNGFGRGRILIDIDHARSGLRGVGVSRSRGLGHLLLDRRSLRG